ncbi:DMT family transporter [Paenibacillus sp. SYP-B3998]|uniref:DMT family transporter n=1 Tax=Paenibacillus sp. SYP-B3998 TaxID=2678564 RepID=A0A6G3ZVZ0_9BACL|nr:DMT family transporter [Paenibacillus sp. SYP-B3998]NEW06386.1 DMT family transporter [Paenibacillus sp. SYP-B3998]
MTSEKFFKHPLGIMLAATLATLLWGSAFPFVKLSYGELGIGKADWSGQLLFAGYRFVLAALLIFLFMVLIGKRVRYQQGTLLKISKIGLFQTFLQYVFFYYGLSASTGIQGSIIAGTTSFFQILLAHFMYKNDRLNIKKILGLVLGFGGAVLVNMTKGEMTLQVGIGEICLLIAMFFGALGNVLSKNEAKELDVLYMTSWQMLLGGVAMFAVGAAFEGPLPFEFTWKTIFMLLYLAFLSGVGFVLWNNVMKYNKVGSISMYLFLIPVFGVILSALMLGEEMHLIVLAALGLVVSGIVIVNRSKSSKIGSTSPGVSHDPL